MKRINEMTRNEIEVQIRAKRKNLIEMIDWVDEWEDFDQRSLLYGQIIREAYELRKLTKRLKKLNINLCKQKITNIAVLSRAN